MKQSLFSRSRKTLIASTLAIAMTAGAAGALAYGGDKQGQRFDYIFNQLNLTEAQATQVQEIMVTFAEEKREAMHERRQSEEERPSEEEREVLREQMRTELADELGTVLQASQVAELMEYLEAHSPKHGLGGKRDGKGGKHGGPDGKRGGDDRQPPPDTDSQ